MGRRGKILDALRDIASGAASAVTGKVPQHLTEEFRQVWHEQFGTWRHEPDLEFEVVREKDGFSIRATSTSKVLLWVSEGTRPHRIRPRPARLETSAGGREKQPMVIALRLRQFLSPASVPGVFGGRTPQYGNVYFRREVTQSIRPRHFGRLLGDEMQRRMDKKLWLWVHRVISRAAVGVRITVREE